MRKTALPKKEREIGLRLSELRESLGLSQHSVARMVGLKRSRWMNYERLRAPLRCDVALRICRELVISEEWLATGKFNLIEAEASRRGIGADPVMHSFYLRQCLDLQTEPEFLQIPPGTLFSEAYQTVLAAKYAVLIRTSFHLPRLVTRDSDSDDLLLRYLGVANQRYLIMLQNEAARQSRGAKDVRRIFTGAQVLFGEVLFKRFMAFETPEVAGPEYAFLRAITEYVDMPIGPIHTQAGVDKTTHSVRLPSGAVADIVPYRDGGQTKHRAVLRSKNSSLKEHAK